MLHSGSPCTLDQGLCSDPQEGGRPCFKVAVCMKVILCQGRSCAPWCSWLEFSISAVFSQRNPHWKGQQSGSSVPPFAQIPSSAPALMNYSWPFIAATSAGHLLLWPSSHLWAPSVPLSHQLYFFLTVVQPPASHSFGWFTGGSSQSKTEDKHCWRGVRNKLPSC